jgi:hypothetical protein
MMRMFRIITSTTGTISLNRHKMYILVVTFNSIHDNARESKGILKFYMFAVDLTVVYSYSFRSNLGARPISLAYLTLIPILSNILSQS